MEVIMAMDPEEVSVHTMNPVHGRGPVFYASLPCGPCTAQTLKECGTKGAGDKHRIASILWDHFVATKSPPGKRCQSSNGVPFPIQVVRGLLGRPHLLLGEYRGPAISFSDGGGKVWAALCGDESDIGIDVAGADDFQKEYPFHRVFHREELQHALRLAGGELEQASALLWSVKEAVVKALGCGFHLVNPRQITVYPSAVRTVKEADGGYTLPVGLSGKALALFPIAVGRSLWVRSLPQKKMWLSIALLSRQHQ
jgi:hypothetical protein